MRSNNRWNTTQINPCLGYDGERIRIDHRLALERP
jgi:hypothetical protein